MALVNWFPKPNADPFTNPFGYNYIQQLQQNQNGGLFRSTLQYNINSQQQPVPGLRTAERNRSGSRRSRLLPDRLDALSRRHHYRRRIEYSCGALHPLLRRERDQRIRRRHVFREPAGQDGQPIGGGPVRHCRTTAGKGFNYLGMYKNNDDYAVPAIANGAGNGYPNLLMPGGFYNNQVHTKEGRSDPPGQRELAVKEPLPAVRRLLGDGHLQRHLRMWAHIRRASTPSTPATAYFEYSSTNQAPYNGCVNPNPAGNLRNSGAAYLGSCYNPTAMMYKGYADSFTQTNFTPTVDMRYTSLAGYANDTLKLHNVTLIFGARIEHLGPWTDRHNNGLATFSDSLYSTECSGYTRNCTSPGFPGITWYSQKTGVSNSVNSPANDLCHSARWASWDISAKARPSCAADGAFIATRSSSIPTPWRRPRPRDYKTSNLVGALTYNQIDSQSPILPPDFSAYVISPKTRCARSTTNTTAESMRPSPGRVLAHGAFAPGDRLCGQPQRQPGFVQRRATVTTALPISTSSAASRRVAPRITTPTWRVQTTTYSVSLYSDLQRSLTHFTATPSSTASAGWAPGIRFLPSLPVLPAHLPAQAQLLLELQQRTDRVGQNRGHLHVGRQLRVRQESGHRRTLQHGPDRRYV